MVNIYNMSEKSKEFSSNFKTIQLKDKVSTMKTYVAPLQNNRTTMSYL